MEAGRLEALGRLDHQLADYAASKAAMLSEYHGVVDRLREHRLGAPCRLVEGKKKCDWTAVAESEKAGGGGGGGGVGGAGAGEVNYEVAETDEGQPIRLCWYPKSATSSHSTLRCTQRHCTSSTLPELCVSWLVLLLAGDQ